MPSSLGGRGRTIAEINVTPLADVMIVLLVIAMVTVPRLSTGPVKTLPASDAARERQGPIEVWIAADGAVFLGAQPLGISGELLPRLDDLRSNRREQDDAAAAVPGHDPSRRAQHVEVAPSLRETTFSNSSSA